MFHKLLAYLLSILNYHVSFAYTSCTTDLLFMLNTSYEFYLSSIWDYFTSFLSPGNWISMQNTIFTEEKLF